MAYDFPKAAMIDGKFGPTDKQHFYKPASYHARSASHNIDKSRWKISKLGEYYVFRIADEIVWYDTLCNGLFTILEDGKEILGSEGERLGFFPKPMNDVDAWHGYPVCSDTISDALIERWYDEKVISTSTRSRLLKHKI